MKITMLAEITGLRDGSPWPVRGETMDVPEDEAQMLVDNGLAKKHEKGDEKLVASAEPVGASTEPVEVTTPPEPETTKAPTAPAKKAPAKRAPKATKKAASKAPAKS